jgi:hypothetical protein
MVTTINHSAADTRPLLSTSAESRPAWMQRHYSVQELMAPWKLSHDSVTGLFRDEPGVIVICPPHRRGVRTKRTLRIPAYVVDRVYEKLTRN